MTKALLDGLQMSTLKTKFLTVSLSEKFKFIKTAVKDGHSCSV